MGHIELVRSDRVVGRAGDRSSQRQRDDHGYVGFGEPDRDGDRKSGRVKRHAGSDEPELHIMGRHYHTRAHREGREQQYDRESDRDVGYIECVRSNRVVRRAGDRGSRLTCPQVWHHSLC